jgi:hypothetical protein
VPVPGRPCRARLRGCSSAPPEQTGHPAQPLWRMVLRMPEHRSASAIPVGTQFSPKLIRFVPFLDAVADHAGDKPAIQAAIFSPDVHLKKTEVPSSHRTASLPIEAAVQYGLVEQQTLHLTPLGEQLRRLSPAEEAFARHILLNLGGLRVVEAVEQMRLDGRKVTSDTLAHYLTSQGFRVSVHNTAVNTLWMWLAEAGVTGNGWTVHTDTLERIIGLDEEQVSGLAALRPDQRAFVRALCVLNPDDWFKAADVRDEAEVLSGLILDRGTTVVYTEPLVQAGLIEVQSGGTKGGKSQLLRLTDNFRADILEPFVTRTVESLDTALISYYKKRPPDIFKELESDDTYVKGRALEAFAVYVMRLLHLRFIQWRKRASATGYAEVDAILAGVLGGVSTRWQVQCKILLQERSTWKMWRRKLACCR